MATSTIDQECDIIEDSATELRELISQISDGEFSFKDKEDKLLELVDKIKESCEDIDGFYDDLESQLETANDKIKDLEEEDEQPFQYHLSLEDLRDRPETDLSSTAIYASNLRDQMILESFAKNLNEHLSNRIAIGKLTA